MRESDIEDYLVRRVLACGGEVRKVKWLGRRGAPDRAVFLPTSPGKIGVTFTPRLVWVELKAPGVKPEDYQLREHERMRKFGQDVRVIDSLKGVDAL